MTNVDPIIYAVGDIHGYADLLDDLLEQIERDAAKYEGRPVEVVFVGDYVDRGPDSRSVVARLREWQPGFSLTFLKGNHEDLLAKVVMETGLEVSADMGQAQTFESYLGHEDEMAGDLFWMTSLPLTKMIETVGKKYLFVHAGIIPDRPLDDQPERALIWIRDEFLNYEGDYGFTVIHGHTPNGSGWPEVKSNRINVDSGAFFAGRLSAVVLGDGEPRFLHAVAGEGWRDDL
jgi:serine/threonine protein phosphatase 1